MGEEEMSLSELVSGILQPVFDLMPQVHARPTTTEWGIADSWLGGVRVFTGPYLHVPATTHCEIYPKVEVPIDTGLQTLTTADGKTVSVNATAIVKIVDPIHLRASVSHAEWEVWLSMRVRGCVQEVVTGHNWQYILDKGEGFIEELVYSELYAFGVEVERVVLEDLAEALTIRLLQPMG